MQPPAPSKILMIGNDPALDYLIGRYAEQGGYGIASMQTIPSAEEACALQPVAILFQSVEGLAASQALVRDLAAFDFPLLVCSSVTDEARARELGADRCLLHPLTCDSVLAALTVADR